MGGDEEENSDSELAASDEVVEEVVAPVEVKKKASAPNSGLKSSKKSAKKQKKGGKKIENEVTPDEDLDAILASVPVTRQVEAESEESKRDKVLREILKVEAANLDPAKEMARIFGTGVVARGDGEGGGGGMRDEGLDERMARRLGGPQANNRRGAGQAITKLRAKTKKVSLVKPKASWAPVGPSGSDGLEMVLHETKKGVKIFKFEWSKDYRQAQKRFHEAVETGDPNALAGLLRRFPYHVDTLLQLHDAFQMTEEKDAALDLLERILYRFESSWIPSFDIISSTLSSSSSSSPSSPSRLPYEHPENRSFHLAMLAYLQEVGKKGCSATALEFSKLLLSLDLSDPLGILFLVDHFALRRREHLWLLRFYHSPLFEEHDLSILPNFVYSIALSAFYYQRSLAEESSQSSSGTTPGDDTSSNTQGEKNHSSSTSNEFAHLNPETLLHTAFEMHPSLFVHLAQRLATGLMRAKDGKNILTDLPHFATAADHTPQTVNILHHLYIERNHALWKDPACITWLKQCAISFYQKLTSSEPSDELTSRIASYRVLVESLGTDNPTRFNRHIMLCDYNPIIRMLPSEVLREGFHIYEFGEVGAPSSPDAPSQRDGSAANASSLARILDYLVPFQADGQQLQNMLNLIGYRVGGPDDDEEEEDEE